MGIAEMIDRAMIIKKPNLGGEIITRRTFVKKIGWLGRFCLLFSMSAPKNGLSFDREKTVVAITKGANIANITREAIDLIGGMRSIVGKGQRVFIKPNYITGGLDGHDPVHAGEIAHPEVVAAVAEECVKAGASHVIIGEWVERPPKILFGGREGKEGAQVENRVERLNKRYGDKIHLINLMHHTSYFTYCPSKTGLRFIAIPDIVASSDVKISIPSLKTHHQVSPVTLGMKNWIGIMPSILYGEPRVKLHEAGIHQIIVDINQVLRPDLTVVDGTFGMEGEGTTLVFGGRPVDISQRIGGFLIIAGRDPVAVDSTAMRAIAKDWVPTKNEDLGAPYYVHHLRLAYAQYLGEIRKSKIEIKGEHLEKVSMNWKMPKGNIYPEKPLP